MNSETKKVELLVLNRQLCVGGAERQIFNLLTSIDSQKFSVNAVPFYSGGELYESLQKFPTVKLAPLRKKSRWDVVPFLFRYFRTLNRIRPHVVYAFMDSANLLAVFAKLFGAKVVWGIRASELEEKDYSKSQQMLSKAEVFFSGMADAQICNSSAGAAYLKKSGFSPKPVAVIPNGIDTKKFFPNPATGLEARKSWGMQPDHLLIGLVARIDPMKDHHTFLRMAAELARTSAHARFICIGNGPQSRVSQLKDFAAELGIQHLVAWLPASSDIASLYNALDIVCLTSAYGEGFPNVLGEAMACGVPCVATDVGDSALVIGQADRISKPGDFNSLASSVSKLIQELAINRSEVKTNARQRIEQNFTINRMTRETEAAILSLLKP